jgi:hypothetical protein
MDKDRVNMLNQLITNSGTYTAKQKKISHAQLLHILFRAALARNHQVASCIQAVERPCYMHVPRTTWEMMNHARMQLWVLENMTDKNEIFEAYCFFRGVHSLLDLKVINMLVTNFGEHTPSQDEISRVQLRQILFIRIKASGY